MAQQARTADPESARRVVEVIFDRSAGQVRVRVLGTPDPGEEDAPGDSALAQIEGLVEERRARAVSRWNDA